MAPQVEFTSCTSLRLISVIFLTISNLCLIWNKWVSFFCFIFFVIFIERLRSQLYKILLNNHEINLRNEKTEILKKHSANLSKIQRKI